MITNRQIRISALLFIGMVISAQGEQPLNTQAQKLLTDSIWRLDPRGVDIAFKEGANANSTSTETKHTPIQVCLLSLIGHEKSHERLAIQSILHQLFDHGGKLTGVDDELFPAICTGSKDILSLLLEHGADPHTTVYGYTTPELAIRYNHKELLPILYQRNVLPPTQSTIAQIELMRGADDRDIRKMEEAIKNGAQVNAYDPSGQTALTEVLSYPLNESGMSALVWLVDTQKADPNLCSKVKNSYGSSPIQNLITHSYGVFPDDLIGEIAKYLIKHGADPNQHNEFGETALHTAIQKDKIHTVKILLAFGADLHKVDFKGNTPDKYVKSNEMFSAILDFLNTQSKHPI